MIFGRNYKVVKKDEWKELQPVPDSIVLTREELAERDKKMIEDAWEAAIKYDNEFFRTMGDKEEIFVPDKEQYMNSVISK